MVEKEFALPDVGEGVAEGELVTWLVEEGERVEEDQPIAEVETDKAMVEIPSAYDGVVAKLHAEEGEIVPVGNVIVTFEVEEAEAPTGGAEVEEEPGVEGGTEKPEAQAGTPASETEEETAPSQGDEPEVPSGRVFAPPHVRRIAREEGVDIRTVEGSGPGGRISEADVREAAEKQAESEGPREFTGGTSAVTKRGEETASGEATAEAEPDLVEATTPGSRRERTLAMPATRELAREKGVDINEVPASEERDGEAFVTPEDVRTYAESQRAAAAEAEAGAVASAAPSTETAGAEAGKAVAEATQAEGPQPGDRVPYRGIRRTIGEQMAKSKFTAPHVSHHDEVDVTDLVETRGRLKETAEERGTKLTYMPFAIKAVVAALKQQPFLNSELDEENEEIILHDEYNIGIAVATDAGLMVPVVKNADQKGLLELAEEIRELASKARNRTITREEMQGSTFTITNLGAVGGEYASPIINYPEAGILALGEIKKKPAVHEGEIVPRDLMTVSLSVDHRIVDGAVAAQFTNEVTRYLNNPDLLLLE